MAAPSCVRKSQSVAAQTSPSPCTAQLGTHTSA